MSLYLSKKDLAALTRASTVLLSPFAYQDEDAWQRAACRAVQDVVGADASSTSLPVRGKPLLGGEPDIVGVLQEILPPPEWVSDALIVQRDRRMNVADWSDVFDVRKVRLSAFYNDVVRPRRLLAPIHVMEDAEIGEVQGSITVYYENDEAALKHVGARKEKLQLLIPAIRAGIRAYTQLAYDRANAGLLAESARTGVLLFDTKGNVLYANSAFARLLANEPERGRVQREAAAAAASVTALMDRRTAATASARRVSSTLHTSAALYKFCAVFIEESWVRLGSTVIVLVDSTQPEAVTAEDLAARFRLTPREIEVTQLLRQGHSTREIADSLGMSVNTARRHLERVLGKLDVHSRAAALAKLASPFQA